MSGRLVRAAALLVGSVLFGSVSACEGADDGGGGGEADPYAGVVAFDTASVRLFGDRDTVRLVVELAVSAEQKTMGLMERRQLADSTGMLFVYESDQAPQAGFWMFRTRIPLDIAFMDSSGVVRAIRTMQPCTASMPQGCPTYTPGAAYRHALEVNAGVFERLGVSVGDSVALPERGGGG